METTQAVLALSALASTPRLEVFRRLVRAGPEGLKAGEVAEAIDSAASTTSNHLAVLTQAGLIQGERAGRTIVYTADYDHMQALLAFLVEDCCGGRPEICHPLAAIAASCAPTSRSSRKPS